MSENMTVGVAVEKADNIIYLLLEHQPRFVSDHGLTGSGGDQIAKEITALRKTLIEELQKQSA